jgi:hypothetical protein
VAAAAAAAVVAAATAAAAAHLAAEAALGAVDWLAVKSDLVDIAEPLGGLARARARAGPATLRRCDHVRDKT